MIRSALKHFIINSVAIYLVSLAISGMVFADGLNTVILTGIALAVTSLVIKPVINILLLPLNLVTFGFFRWVGYAVALYIVTLLVPGFKIANFAFNGLSTYWISIPPVSLNGILAFVAFSFALALTSSVIGWLLK